MAVDYGDSRTGVVVSDETATIPGDAWVISEKHRHTLAQTITDEAKARGVGKIVIGYPMNMDGTIGIRAEKSEHLAEKLRSMSDIEVVLCDERLTSIQAERILHNSGKQSRDIKNTIDAVAAALILESYLQRMRNK